MPTRVACRQNPANPTLSSPTDSQRSATNTCRLHSGELPAITTAATTPIIPATRSGWVRRPGDDLGVARRADLPGGFLQQAVGGAGDQTERAPEHPEYRKASWGQVAGCQVDHRVAADSRQRGRRADTGYAAPRDWPGGGCGAADLGHCDGTSIAQSRISQAGRFADRAGAKFTLTRVASSATAPFSMSNRPNMKHRNTTSAAEPLTGKIITCPCFGRCRRSARSCRSAFSHMHSRR